MIDIKVGDRVTLGDIFDKTKRYGATVVSILGDRTNCIILLDEPNREGNLAEVVWVDALTIE